MTTHITNNEEETRKLAATFASQLQGGELVELIGDLGSGKTTFVRGIAESFGAEVRVKSPTFTVMNEYPVNHSRIKRIIHIDFYRFQDPTQLEALALGDYRNVDTIIFIEWPDIFGTSAVTATDTIKFEFVDENTRRIEI